MKGKCNPLSGHPNHRELIDYPVSRIWRDYYRKGGYATGSGSYPPTHGQTRSAQREISELWSRVLMLESHSIVLETILTRILAVLGEKQEREKGSRRPKKRN